MKRLLCAILAALVAFSAAACGKKETRSGSAEKTETAEETSGGRITVYSLRDDTLCPILTDNDANRQMLGIVFERLVRLGADMEAEGVLATDWSVSDDGLSWTFNIRGGVKWHDGELLTPADVVYTVEQIQKNADSSYYESVRRIASAQAYSDFVEFNLSEPCANFVNLMTFPVIKRQNGDIDRANYIPCGTGAYIFSDKNEGNTYYLLRNENWWGGRGKLDEICVKFLPDSETVMYSFSAGDIDIAHTERGQWGRFVSRSTVRSRSCSHTVYDFIGINHNNAALKNKEVREAIDKAVNRGKIVDDIFAGNASPAKSPVRDDWFLSGGAKTDDKADASGAEQALTDNGWKKSGGVYRKKIGESTVKLEFALIVNDDNSNRMNIAESVKFDLESAGIAVNVIPLPYEEYEARIQSGNYELFVGGVMLSEELDFRALLGDGNMFGYEDENMSKILAQTQTATDREDIIARYGRFMSRFDSEVPLAGLCFENFDVLYNSRVQGNLKSSPGNIYDGIYDLYVKE